MVARCVTACVKANNKGPQNICDPLLLLEAASGFEPLNTGVF
jgi:hypothetical protein